MQAPPPPMSGMMMDRKKMGIGFLLIGGLLLLAAGAMLVDASHSQFAGTPTPEQAAAQANLGLVWGPAVAHFGMFLLVAGLLAAAIMLEDVDVFVRLFLLILSFVALLLVLANSSTLFG